MLVAVAYSNRCTRDNASLIAACDPDTIRELLAERDALRDFVEAKMHHLPIEDQHVASILVGEQAAFVAGDTAELGRLVDQAVREYCGEVMELDQ